MNSYSLRERFFRICAEMDPGTENRHAFHTRDAGMLSLSGLMRKGIEHISGPTARLGMISLGDQAVVSAANFLTAVIIGRACTKEEFGLYMLGYTIVLLVTELQMSLISTPYIIYSPRFKGAAHALYTGSSLIHQFALSAAVIISLAAGGMGLSLGIGPPGLAPVVWTLVLAVTFIMLKEYVRRLFFARLQMKTALLLDSCAAVSQIGGLLFLSYLGVLSASRAYWLMGAASGMAAFAGLIKARKGFTVRLGQAMLDLRHNWDFGKWIFASGLLWNLSMSLYPWFLSVFHGTASAGVWAACVGLVAIANPLLLGVSNVFGPMMAHSFAEGGCSALRQFAFRTSLVSSVLLIPFCLTLLAFGALLMALLYGGKYAGNGMIVSVLVVNVLVTGASIAYPRALFVLGRADVEFMVNSGALVVLLTLGIWLTRAWGPLGAAYGLLIANLTAQVPKAVMFAVLTSPSQRKQTA
jgi:O-antigen/teichoic acid export membrane protein